jgi:hypothetical protein
MRNHILNKKYKRKYRAIWCMCGSNYCCQQTKKLRRAPSGILPYDLSKKGRLRPAKKYKKFNRKYLIPQ